MDGGIMTTSVIPVFIVSVLSMKIVNVGNVYYMLEVYQISFPL